MQDFGVRMSRERMQVVLVFCLVFAVMVACEEAADQPAPLCSTDGENGESLCAPQADGEPGADGAPGADDGAEPGADDRASLSELSLSEPDVEVDTLSHGMLTIYVHEFLGV